MVLLSASDGSVQRTFRSFAADEDVNGFFRGADRAPAVQVAGTSAAASRA